MRSMNRRGFLKGSAAAATGIIAGSPLIKKTFAKNSPNDSINIGVAGIRGREESGRVVQLKEIKP